MGNTAISASDSDVQDYFTTISPEEAVKNLVEKQDKNPVVASILTSMNKSIIDLASSETLQTKFLPIEDVLSYSNPTIENVIEYALKAQIETQKNDRRFQRKSGEYNPSTEPQINIKFGIVEVTDYTSPVVALDAFKTLQFAQEFGSFHSILVVGPWKLEWNETGVIIPRKCVISEVTGITIGSFTGVEKIKEKLESLADVITEYNALSKYDAETCNCQHFVDDVCKRLLGGAQSFSGQLDAYVNSIRATGKKGCVYTIPKRVLDKINKKKITFKTIDVQETEIVFFSHEQLDEVVRAVIVSDPNYFATEGMYDKLLLHCFDRAFWVRYFKYGIEHEKAHKDFKPLGYCVSDEESKKWGTSSRSIGCPFSKILEYRYRFELD
jgi:hypothetical protein